MRKQEYWTYKTVRFSIALSDGFSVKLPEYECDDNNCDVGGIERDPWPGDIYKNEEIAIALTSLNKLTDFNNAGKKNSYNYVVTLTYKSK